MIGVDVNEAGVESDGAFVKSDEEADIKSVHLGDGDGDRFPAALVEGGARSAQKSLEIIAARDAFLDFEPGAPAILFYLHERNEEIRDTVPQLLHVGVLIRRSLVAVHDDALLDDIALKIFL